MSQTDTTEREGKYIREDSCAVCVCVHNTGITQTATGYKRQHRRMDFFLSPFIPWLRDRHVKPTKSEILLVVVVWWYREEGWIRQARLLLYQKEEEEGFIYRITVWHSNREMSAASILLSLPLFIDLLLLRHAERCNALAHLSDYENSFRPSKLRATLHKKPHIERSIVHRQYVFIYIIFLLRLSSALDGSVHQGAVYIILSFSPSVTLTRS